MIVDRFIKVKTESPESRSRAISALKAVSWRIVGTLDTLLISYLITGKANVAISIASVEVISKMVLYYFHERVWESVKAERK